MLLSSIIYGNQITKRKYNTIYNSRNQLVRKSPFLTTGFIQTSCSSHVYHNIEPTLHILDILLLILKDYLVSLLY